MKRLIVFCFLLVALLLPAQPAHAWSSPITQRYNSEPELRALLGAPIRPEYSVAGGAMRTYENGTLYYKRSTGVHEAHGVIRDKFREEGGLQTLGFPLTDEQDVIGKYNSIGRESVFQYGNVVWSEVEGAHWMDRDIALTWHENIYPYLYMPTSDQLPEGSGAVIYFYSAAIHKRWDGTTWVELPDWVPVG